MSNLADLDNLMADLDSARRPGGGLGQTRVYAPGSQVTHTFSRSENTVTLSGDRNRDSPARERGDERSASPQISRPKSPASNRKVQPVAQSPRQAGGATAELDDLMASLNDFKVTNDGTVKRSSETTTTTTYSSSSSRDQQQQQHRAPSASPAPYSEPQNKYGGNVSSNSTNHQHDRSERDVNYADRGGADSRNSDLGDNQCAGCQKNVNGQVVTALGKVWHMECFRCGHCQNLLRTQPFFEKGGKAYCEKDYYELFAMKCARCKGPIKDTCFTALDQTWHPECFCCARCSTAFGESSFHERDGKPFCEQCYLKSFAPQCAGCQKPIAGTYLTALDAQWHRDCFICNDCRKPFDSGSFFDLDGRPYCEQHYHANRGSVCGTCQQPISGRCVTAMGKKFHPDHFVCSYCVRPLNKGTFKEHPSGQGAKPWCHNCFDRLYGSKKEDGFGAEEAVSFDM
ncbi:Paxillin [Hypsibius exemplaris]|uniref:Paxillin n=1 Tax=Hypsibius exemplaris TaxID=2072580 RepID=A0A1W0X371_HYPEX|nr:Paxillin [Hypsibius exemplaris]